MGDNDQNNTISDNNVGGKAIVTFPAESMILKEGEVNLDMYKIIQGKAEMYIGYGTENEILLRIIGPGTCFGEMGLLLEAPSNYTLIAYTDVYAIRVTQERMGNFIKDNQATVLQIMKNMARTMNVMQYQITSLSEELNLYAPDKNEEEVKKDILTSYYNPHANFQVGMSGQMHFLGKKK